MEFQPIPEVPEIPGEGLLDWQSIMFNSIKENVELLSGTRGPKGLASKALLRGDIKVQESRRMTLQEIAAQGVGFNIGGENVASLEDHGKLINDVTLLANDVVEIRDVLNTLIRNLQGST
jgi:hypothetical protein